MMLSMLTAQCPSHDVNAATYVASFFFLFCVGCGSVSMNFHFALWQYGLLFFLIVACYFSIVGEWCIILRGAFSKVLLAIRTRSFFYLVTILSSSRAGCGKVEKIVYTSARNCMGDIFFFFPIVEWKHLVRKWGSLLGGVKLVLLVLSLSLSLWACSNLSLNYREMIKPVPTWSEKWAHGVQSANARLTKKNGTHDFSRSLRTLNGERRGHQR